MSVTTLHERTLKMMNIMLHMYNARENQGQRDDGMEAYSKLVADNSYVFSVPEAIYLTPRMSHQAVNDDMPRQLALHHKPRGLTFQIIISIDDDNSMLYANYGSSAIICYKHNSEPLDLEKLPANNGVFDYTFFSQNSLEASLDSFIERVNNASGQFLFQYHPNLLSTEKSTFVDAQLEHDSTSLEAILSALWNKTNENNFRAKISFPFNSGYVAGHYWSNGPSASTTRREVDQFVQNLSPATYQRRSFPGPSGSDVSNGSKRMSIVFDLGRVIMEVSA